MEITKGNTTFTGVKENDNAEIVCIKCGRSDKCQLTMHSDGKEFYLNKFKCECGNVITTKIKRTGINKRYWED